MGWVTLDILRAFIPWASRWPEDGLTNPDIRAPTTLVAICFDLDDFALRIFLFFHMEHHAKYHKQPYDTSYVYQSNVFDSVGLDVFSQKL